MWVGKEQGQEGLKKITFFFLTKTGPVSFWLFYIPVANPPFCLLHTYSLFGSFLPWRWWRQVPLKCLYLSSNLYGVTSHRTVILTHCVRSISLQSRNCVHRLRSRCRESTVARRMRCTPHRKALRTKLVMSTAGKTCLCRWASALNLQPMGYPALCSSHRVTLMRGWHSAVLACRPYWVGVRVQAVVAHPLS